jgi:sodium/potassium/calcium exchanger 6
VWNGDVVVSKFLLLCELPFTTLRKLTVPIPCEGFYVRAMVALSVAISPVWLLYYLWNMHGLNLLDDGGWFYFLVLWSLFVFGSALILRYAPGGEGDMSLHLATPIALYGFAIAATWIDTIADNLVNLLDFVGIILKIRAPIVGLTILAWGNSMGDLSANMTMARKGLANMAMTACFAGPLTLHPSGAVWPLRRAR